MKDYEIKIEGPIFEVVRVPTGLWSLDKALGFKDQLGMPLRAVYEVYGPPGSGKSTLSQYLAAKARPDGKLVMVDLEISLDPKYLDASLRQAGFHGSVQIIERAKVVKGARTPRTHEEMVQEAADMLLDDDVGAVVIDSVGTFAPIAEMEGDIGEAFMGRRAKAIAQLSRRCLAWLGYVDQPKVVIAVNHVLSSMGGTSKGHYTPGGETKEFAATARIMMWRKDSDFEGGCFQSEIRVEKLRLGGTRRDERATVFFIPGVGISPEMTTVFDCFRMKLAERGATVKLGKKSMGRIGALIEAAANGEIEKFEPFHKALANYKGEESVEEDEES